MDDDFGALYQREYPPVLRTVALIVGSEQAAHDVTQDAFVQLCQHWPLVRTYERPGAWVRRVAIRQAVKVSRRSRIVTAPAAEPLSATAAAPLGGAIYEPAYPTDHGEVTAAVQALPPRQRAVVVCHYYLDLPVAEIAEMLGIRTGSVKAHLHQARASLARTLAASSAAAAPLRPPPAAADPQVDNHPKEDHERR